MKRPELTSVQLHILAMALMLCDHLWAAVFPNVWILTCIGRLAYPIFAFLLVEGFFHTRDVRRYARRLLLFALISEIPFDLLYSGVPVYWFHQNVLWTYLIALGGMVLMERAKGTGKWWIILPMDLLTVIVCMLVSIVCITDFNAFGILMIFTFYFFRGRKWWCFAGQVAAMWMINVELMGGMYYPVTLFGHSFEFMQQGFALLALIPIWLYRGRKGEAPGWFSFSCYGFYPVHCLMLGLYSIL